MKKMLRRRLLNTLLYLPLASLVVYSVYATAAFVALEEARTGWAALSTALADTPPPPDDRGSIALLKKEAGMGESVEAFLDAASKLRLLPAVHHSAEEEHLLAQQRELAQLEPAATFAHALLSERLRFLRELDAKPKKAVIPPPTPEIRNPLLRKALLLDIRHETIELQNKVHYTQFLKRHLEHCFNSDSKGHIDTAAIHAAIDELKTSFAKAPIPVASFASATELLRFFEKAAPEAARLQAWRNQALVAVALARYQQAHGTLPEKLEALQPWFLPEIPLDPLSNEPLHYSREGEHFTLASLSWEQVSNARKGDPEWVLLQ